MPAHLGMKDRLKLPAALIAVKLRNLVERRQIVNGTSYGDLQRIQDHNRQGREVRCTSLSTYRLAVAVYGPNGHATRVSATDWSRYLGPDGYVDSLVEASFDLDTARSVTLITRKSARSELKRIELTRDNGNVEIIWTRPR
jgi:hypothetical protein